MSSRVLGQETTQLLLGELRQWLVGEEETG